MILTGISNADLARALREQSLLKRASGWIQVMPPPGALESLARSLHEHEVAIWDETASEQQFWDRLPQGAKISHLNNAAWFLGRLAADGYVVRPRRGLKAWILGLGRREA